jgi:hypothetical protein
MILIDLSQKIDSQVYGKNAQYHKIWGKCKLKPYRGYGLTPIRLCFYCTAFHCCNKIPDMVNLKEERFILAHFRGFSSGSLDSIVSGTWWGRASWYRVVWQRRLLTPWQLRSRRERKGLRPRHIIPKGMPHTSTKS